MELTKEQKQELMDMGALGYDAARRALVFGVSREEFKSILDEGGQELLDMGKARFQFQVDRKLMEMAAKGDLKAMKKLEIKNNG